MMRVIRALWNRIDRRLLHFSPIWWKFYGLHMLILLAILGGLMLIISFFPTDGEGVKTNVGSSGLLFLAYAFFITGLNVGSILFAYNSRDSILYPKRLFIRSFLAFSFYAAILQLSTLTAMYHYNVSFKAKKIEAQFVADLQLENIDQVYSIGFRSQLVKSFRRDSIGFRKVLYKYRAYSTELSEDVFGNPILVFNFDRSAQPLVDFVDDKIKLKEIKYYVGNTPLFGISFTMLLLLISPYLFIIFSSMPVQWSASMKTRIVSSLFVLFFGLPLVFYSLVLNPNPKYIVCLALIPVLLFLSLTKKRDGVYINKFLYTLIVSSFLVVVLLLVGNVVAFLINLQLLAGFISFILNEIVFLVLANYYIRVLSTPGIDGSLLMWKRNFYVNKLILDKEA